MSEQMAAKSIRVPSDLWQAAMEKAAEADTSVSAVIRDALASFSTHCTECSCDTCGLDTFDAEPDTARPNTAAIHGYGRLHTESNDPETLRLVARAIELLKEGAVAVSVATDLNPDDLDPDMLLEGGEPDWDKIAEAGIRIRHVAIEDTAAFSDARMTYNDESGEVAGPVTFEGIPTGDLRILPYHSLLWEDTLPVTLKMGHDGPVIGVIDRMERVEGEAAPTGAEPVAASTGTYPAKYFAQPEPGPFTIGLPDKDGYRHVYGTVAPAGVCHKGKGTCYTYKGASLDYFHSGSAIALDNGQRLRVGPLVAGGLHADPTNFNYNEAEALVADSRSVFAMGRMFDTPKGLLFSGILMPDVDQTAVTRLEACAPSVELWPDHRGRLELKTALMVPRPGFPVAASIGAGGVQIVEADGVQVLAAEAEPVAPHPNVDESVMESLHRLESAVAMLVAAHVAATID